MDPCTLSSIKFFTEGVLIPSPCPRAPESCQNLLFMPEPRFSLFSRASPRSILSTVSRFLSGLRCFLLGRVALLWVSIQWVLCFFFIVASRRKKYDVAPPLKIIRRGWWWAGRGGGGREEAGLVIAAPTPFPSQPLRFHLVFVNRFVFSVVFVPSHASGPKRLVLSEPFR